MYKRMFSCVVPIKGSRLESGTAPAAVFEYVDCMAGRPATGSNRSGKALSTDDP